MPLMSTTRRSSLFVAALLSTLLPAAALAQRGQQPVRPARPVAATATAARTPHAAPRLAPTRTTATSVGKPEAWRGKATKLTRGMERDIKQGTTPFLELVQVNKTVKLKQTAFADYDKGTFSKFNVTGLGAEGTMDLVALLPVSGHVGLAEAKQYAASNQYNITITHADGTNQQVGKTTSTGFVTEKQIGLKLKPGTTRIEFWADGSAGVGGYTAGRRIEFTWDGK